MRSFPNEPVDVTVDFTGPRVRPCAVRYAGHLYPITKVSSISTLKEGPRRIFYFSVSDPSNFFKLRFDAESLEWRLIERYAQ